MHVKGTKRVGPGQRKPTDHFENTTSLGYRHPPPGVFRRPDGTQPLFQHAPPGTEVTGLNSAIPPGPKALEAPCAGDSHQVLKSLANLSRPAGTKPDTRHPALGTQTRVTLSRKRRDCGAGSTFIRSGPGFPESGWGSDWRQGLNLEGIVDDRDRNAVERGFR